MSPQEAIQLLVGRGLTQPEIVQRLLDRGIQTTQETISRIGSGATSQPKFALGCAIVRLAEEELAKAA